MYSFYINRKVIEMTNGKLDLLMAICLIYEAEKERMFIREGFDGIVCCSPQGVIKRMIGQKEFTKREAKDVVDSIQSLIDLGLISLVHEGDEVSFKEAIQFNVTNLIHHKDSGESFVPLSIDDLATILNCTEYKEVNEALEVMLNVTSYIDQREVAYVGEDDDLTHEVYMMDSDELQQARRISCWASIERLCHSKHSMEEPNEDNWISNKTLIKVLKHLNDINVISTIKPQGKKTTKKNIVNHYCYKRHEKHTQKLVDKYAGNINFMLKGEDTNGTSQASESNGNESTRTSGRPIF